MQPHIDPQCENYQSRSTVQDGKEATTPISSLHLKVLLICVENQLWNPMPHTQHRPICVRADPVIVGTSNTIQKVFQPTESRLERIFSGTR